MKRGQYSIVSLLISIMITASLVLGAVLPALACDMNLNADKSSVASGDIVTFTLERYATHRTCSVPLEDTDIDVTGGSIVDPGIWQPGTPDILIFTVRFDQPGTGTVTVTRTCDKEPNLTVSSSVSVTGSPAASAAAPDHTQGTGSDGANLPSDKAATGTETIASTGPGTLMENRFDAGIDGILPGWLLIDSNWAWWTAFLVLALGLFLLKKQAFRRPLLMASLVVLGFYLGACPCPMGGIFKLFLQSVSVVFLLVLLASLAWGRFFCGWLCPMGAFQAFTHARGLKWQVPERIDHYLKAVKYLVLAGLIIATAWTGVNAWIDYDPFKALFNFRWTMAAGIILVLVLAGNLIIERFFCRYLCPMGALLAIINQLRGLANIGPTVIDCSGCRKCVKQGCPTGALQMVGEGKAARAVIDPSECIACRACESACSKKCIQIPGSLPSFRTESAAEKPASAIPAPAAGRRPAPAGSSAAIQ